MRFDLKLLEKSFRTAIEEELGPSEATEENPLDYKHISCSSSRFSDALFVVKMNHYEAGLCQANVMSADEFDVRWNVFFADFERRPLRHVKAPRQQIKYANHILVQSMYGAEVANGMKPEAFDPSMAICFMNCIADMPDSIYWSRDLFADVLDRALEIYPALEMQAKLKVELEEKSAGKKAKI